MVRLTEALSQTVPLSEWAARQCQCEDVTEHGDVAPNSVDDIRSDYAVVMAMEGDGSEARQWSEVLQRRKPCRSILALTHWPENESEFGGGWDVTIVDRSGRFDAVLPILLSSRLLPFDDEALFGLLGTRPTIVFRPSVENVIDSEFLRSASGFVVHMTTSAGSWAEEANLTLSQAVELGREVREMAEPTTKLLFSVGAGCHAGSQVQIFAVQSTYGRLGQA